MAKSTFLIVRCSLLKCSKLTHDAWSSIQFLIAYLLMVTHQTRYWSWLRFEAAFFTAKLQLTFAKAIIFLHQMNKKTFFFARKNDVCPLFDQFKCNEWKNYKGLASPQNNECSFWRSIVQCSMFIFVLWTFNGTVWRLNKLISL